MYGSSRENACDCGNSRVLHLSCKIANYFVATVERTIVIVVITMPVILFFVWIFLCCRMVKSKEEIKLAIPARRPNVPPIGSHWGFTLKGTKHWEEIYFIFFIKTSVHLDRKARASQAASGRFTVVETQPLTVHYCTIVSQISYEKDSINSTVIEIKKCTFWFLNIMWLTHLIQKKQCQQVHLLLTLIFKLCPSRFMRRQ